MNFYFDYLGCLMYHCIGSDMKQDVCKKKNKNEKMISLPFTTKFN